MFEVTRSPVFPFARKEYFRDRMLAELESRAATATTSLTSSFLPKCTQLLQLKVAHCPASRTKFHGVVASTKQKKKGSSSPTRGWSYEHFMVLWDEVFELCCTDPVKATQIKNLASKGLSKHGRGCVLVFQEVQTRPRGSGTGFTSKPPKSSRRVPDFVTFEYYAVYLPREFLLDPRKAPLDEDMAGLDDMEQSCENADHVVVEKPGDESRDANLMAERQDNDSKMGAGDSGGKVINIQDIIREAQDVYQFYSDDEDGHDAATDDDDTDDEGGGRDATDSLLIFDGDVDESNVGLGGKERDSAPNRKERDAEGNLVDDHDTSPVNASDKLEKREPPLLIIDDVDDVGAEPHVLTSISREIEHKKVSNGFGDPMFVDGSAHPERDWNDAMLGSRTIIEEEHMGSSNFEIEHHSTSTLGESMSFDSSASAAQSVGELLEEGNRRTQHQVEHNASGSVVPTVDSLDESFEADTFESSESVAIEKVSLGYQGDKEESKDDGVELATQQMLYAAMRGMDRTRLLSLTANFDFEAERFKFGRRMAVIDVKTADAGGEDPYNPKEEELVLLLHLLIDGKPAYGADVVVAYRDESQIVGVEGESWKLRGKYRRIFA